MRHLFAAMVVALTVAFFASASSAHEVNVSSPSSPEATMDSAMTSKPAAKPAPAKKSMHKKAAKKSMPKKEKAAKKDAKSKDKAPATGATKE